MRAVVGGIFVLLALARRRPLLVAMALAVALAGFVAPVAAGVHGHCVESGDQHCAPVLAPVEPLPAPALFGFVEPSDPAASPPLVVAAILKIPLPA